MKSFSSLMDRLDKAKKESEEARNKERLIQSMVNKRAKFLGFSK